jgi:thioredoxin-like negative regulator of GroEL
MGHWHTPSVALSIIVVCAIVLAFVPSWVFALRGNDIVERFDDQGLADVDRPTLTLYYVEWCPFSVQMMPEWNKLTQRLLGSQINVSKVDADASPGQAQAEGVRAFPTVLLTKNGATTTFEGERTADMMMRFVQLS